MSLFAIRDDDTSFWTDPDELERIYRPLWNRDIAVSLAVIPAAVRSVNPGEPSRFYQELPEKGIEENAGLVSFLQQQIAAGKIEIMLHGYNHLYQVAGPIREPEAPAEQHYLERLRAGGSEKKLFWRGEYIWKDYIRLSEETCRGKAALEKLLQCEIKIFVPPSNQIAKAGIQAIEAANLNLSGIIGYRYDRSFDWRGARAYLKRWLFHFRTGQAFPFVLDYGKHRELVAYSLTPAVDLNQMKSKMIFCKELKAPFVLGTHHWELNRHPQLRETLYELCEEARRLEFRFTTVSQCLRSDH